MATPFSSDVMVRSEKFDMVENALRSMTSSPFVKSVMTSFPWSGPKMKASAPAPPVSVSLPEVRRAWFRQAWRRLLPARDVLTLTDAPDRHRPGLRESARLNVPPAAREGSQAVDAGAGIRRRLVELKVLCVEVRGVGVLEPDRAAAVRGEVDYVNAYRTLTDGLAFADAVATAAGMTSEQDTLIVVTADHGHVLTIAGYPARGNPILGLSRNAAGELNLALDGKPYTTLEYANGATGLVDEPRADLTEVDTTDPDFVQQALVPLSSETHSGEDIAVYARGPWAHLFQTPSSRASSST